MQPSEVRQAIRAQHEELRGLLRSLDEPGSMRIAE